MDSDSRALGRVALDRSAVLREVSQIIADQLGMEANKIREGDTLTEDLGCDSLDVVEISMELEEHFDISIPDEFAESARTVGDVTEGTLRLLGADTS